MTFYAEAVGPNGTGERRVEVWYLDESKIAVTSGTAVTTMWERGAQSDHGVMYAFATFDNVDQVAPISGDASDIDDTMLSFTPLTVATGDYVVAAAVNGYSNSGTWAVTSGYTEQAELWVGDSNHSLQDRRSSLVALSH